MFSDEYIQYIIDLPVPLKENFNERILPKWIINTFLHPDTVPNLTGCKYAKSCKELQCPYLYPKYKYPETNTTQVNHINHNAYTIVDHKYHSHMKNSYGKHTRYKHNININTFLNMTAQTPTGRVPKPRRLMNRVDYEQAEKEQRRSKD
jgi:hypothetical protein